MQEDRRNVRDDSEIIQTSEPFTIMRTALDRQIISSANYNWLKLGPANQPGGHLSASLSGPECNEKFFRV